MPPLLLSIWPSTILTCVLKFSVVPCSITWWFVSTQPAGSMMTPLPSPPFTRTITVAGATVRYTSSALFGGRGAERTTPRLSGATALRARRSISFGLATRSLFGMACLFFSSWVVWVTALLSSCWAGAAGGGAAPPQPTPPAANASSNAQRPVLPETPKASTTTLLRWAPTRREPA